MLRIVCRVLSAVGGYKRWMEECWRWVKCAKGEWRVMGVWKLLRWKSATRGGWRVFRLNEGYQEWEGVLEVGRRALKWMVVVKD